jgi:hypothetical protein
MMDVRGRICRMHGAIKNAYTILVGKPWRIRLLGRDRSDWECNIIMALWENYCKAVE